MAASSLLSGNVGTLGYDARWEFIKKKKKKTLPHVPLGKATWRRIANRISQFEAHISAEYDEREVWQKSSQVVNFGSTVSLFCIHTNTQKSGSHTQV